MSDLEPEYGEIWQDSEGCLLCILRDGLVAAFKSGEEHDPHDWPDRDRPAKRVFDVEGKYVGDGALDYPGKSAFRPSPTSIIVKTVDNDGHVTLTSFIG